MSTNKKVFAVLGISVLTLGAIAIGSAQSTANNVNSATEAQISAHRGGQQGQGANGFLGGRMGKMGQRGGGFLNAAEGTTVTATFYTADPAQGGTVINSLSFVGGQDSESAFQTNMQEAMETAAFATITTGPQSRTLEVPQNRQGFGNFANRMGKGNRVDGGMGSIGKFAGLSDGSTVQINFYEADPAQGTAAISSLSFTQGQDSESAFMESVQAAMETASFVQVNTPELTRSMDLEARRTALEEGGRSQRGKGFPWGQGGRTN